MSDNNGSKQVIDAPIDIIAKIGMNLNSMIM